MGSSISSILQTIVFCFLGSITLFFCCCCGWFLRGGFCFGGFIFVFGLFLFGLVFLFPKYPLSSWPSFQPKPAFLKIKWILEKKSIKRIKKACMPRIHYPAHWQAKYQNVPENHTFQVSGNVFQPLSWHGTHCACHLHVTNAFFAALATLLPQPRLLILYLCLAMLESHWWRRSCSQLTVATLSLPLQ